MRLRPWLPLTLLVFCAAPVLGLTPRLVKDVNPFPSPVSSLPGAFVPVGSLTYFTADDRETGRELWRTDGTSAGTFRLLDACPDGCHGNPFFAAREESRYFFTANYNQYWRSLWMTRGTPATTFRLTSEDVRLADYGRWRVWVPEQGLLYFAANDGSHGMELWRSDGTAVGTFQVADIRPGSEGSLPFEMTSVGGRLFFAANDGRGDSLWTSDGTARGTRLVRDPDPRSSNHQSPEQLIAVGRTLFFTVPVPGKGRQLWKSDGTMRGTVPLTQLATQLPDGNPFRDLRALGKRLLFVADTTGNRQELWASDGTAKGTRALTRYTTPDALLLATGNVQRRATIGNRLIFEAKEEGLGNELWVTDGTPQGTRIVRDVCPGPCSGAAALEATLTNQSRLFFQGNDGTRGAELWVTDGTAAGTRIVRDLCRGSCGSFARSFSSGSGRTFFLAGERRELWLTNGTSRGTVKLADLKELEGDNVYFGLFWGSFAGGRFVFNASDDHDGIELWASDGTAGGTGLLTDIAPDLQASSYPSAIGEFGGKLYFFANDGQHGYELWASDGSETGTVLVHEFAPGPEPGYIPVVSPVEAGGRLFLELQLEGESEFSLWRTDGTSAGTFQLTPEGLAVRSVLVALGNSVCFTAEDEEHGTELWTSDGTVEGTRRLDLAPGIEDPAVVAAFNGKLFFMAEEPATSEHQLWSSDGTLGGTRLLASFDRDLQSSLVEYAGRLWFFADTRDFGVELWSTDGTPAGTRLAFELEPGNRGGQPTHLISTGSRLFFAHAGNQHEGLWVSDGTLAGTHRVSGSWISSLENPAIFNGELYYASERGLWKSDGTEAGTREILDRDGKPIPGPGNFQIRGGRLYFLSRVFPQDGALFETDGTPAGTFKVLDDVGGPLVSAGGRLFFSHHDPATGNELWGLE